MGSEERYRKWPCLKCEYEWPVRSSIRLSDHLRTHSQGFVRLTEKALIKVVRAFFSLKGARRK